MQQEENSPEGQEVQIITEEEKEPEVLKVESQEANSDEHKQEVEAYSDKVQKRIDKLTYNQREAERQRDEALRVANTLKTKVEQFEQKSFQTDDALLKEYNSRVGSELEMAKDQYRKAVEEADVEAQLASQQNIAKLAVEQETLSRTQKQRETMETNGAHPPPIDPRATAWAQQPRNKWFGKDPVMTAAAFAIDKQMQEEGIDPSAGDYYKLLNKRITKAFPQKFKMKKKTTEGASKASPVQAVGRTSVGANPTTRKTRTVKLSSSQLAIAKKLGVPPEEYAKYV